MTIAGFDPSGGAGITADMEVLSRFGQAAAVITAVTYQNPDRVEGIHPLPPEAVISQFEAVSDYYRVMAVKIGLIYSPALVETVARIVGSLKDVPTVLDPILRSTSGTPLLLPEAKEALIADLLPTVKVVTPNLPELAALTAKPVDTADQETEAARALLAMGVKGVIVTGGHRPGDPDDRLVTAGEVIMIPGRRRDNFYPHGGGCRYSAALAAYLGEGFSLTDAARAAKKFVAEEWICL